MVAYFQLQPSETELQELAEQYWQKAGEREHELESAAFEAGEAIRNGDYSLANLEAIVRWKSERAVHYLIGNSNEKIRRVLSVAASPESNTEAASASHSRCRAQPVAPRRAAVAAGAGGHRPLGMPVSGPPWGRPGVGTDVPGQGEPPIRLDRLGPLEALRALVIAVVLSVAVLRRVAPRAGRIVRVSLCSSLRSPRRAPERGRAPLRRPGARGPSPWPATWPRRPARDWSTASSDSGRPS